MTLLYQPISRTFGQRDGCLTPNNHHEDKGSFSLKSGLGATLRSAHDIISPPLSPCHKAHDAHLSATVHNASSAFAKVYLDTRRPFRVEDFTRYTLTVNPWSNLSANYKQRQLRFLNQYTTVLSRDNTFLHSLRLAERRRAQAAAANRKRHTTSSSDSDSESVDRVRTRRVAKEQLVPLSEIDASSVSAPGLPSPKKRKVRKESPYVGSPLAVQQAALIDESIPDYSPDAFETLPKGNARCLKIEWKGQPMDLRSDPNLDKLHPAEATLASTLRLPCNVYLDSKRRLFFEKVNRLRNGMPFRRTDAQKACRIDVNKASRLFAAYEKVGWLDDSHFAKYL